MGGKGGVREFLWSPHKTMLETPLWRMDLERGEEVRIYRLVLIGYSKPNQFSIFLVWLLMILWPTRLLITLSFVAKEWTCESKNLCMRNRLVKEKLMFSCACAYQLHFQVAIHLFHGCCAMNTYKHSPTSDFG